MVSGLTPILLRHHSFSKIIDVDTFPTKEECFHLLGKYDHPGTGCDYRLYTKRLAKRNVEICYDNFDYSNDFFARTASCIYKGYVLLHTNGTTFGEEIYTNVYIALEAIVEYFKTSSKKDRKTVVKEMANNIDALLPGTDFEEYEEEMRDTIRNDIVHPYREKEKRTVPQPFMMADYVFGDLGFVDWIFKKVLGGVIRL